MFDFFVELIDRGDEGELKYGVDRGDLVREEVEFIRGELLRLLGEVFLKIECELLFGRCRLGVFFTETDEFLSHITTFDAAGDAFGKKLESKGDEGSVLAAEDGGTLEVGEGLGEEILVEPVS